MDIPKLRIIYRHLMITIMGSPLIILLVGRNLPK
jgi:hypothetical protein